MDKRFLLCSFFSLGISKFENLVLSCYNLCLGIECESLLAEVGSLRCVQMAVGFLHSPPALRELQ